MRLDCERSKGLAGCQSGLNLQNTPPRFKQLACVNLKGLDHLGDALPWGFWFDTIRGWCESCPVVALKQCLDEKHDVKERKHLDAFMMQSVLCCSFLYHLGWFQQAGVLTLLGTLQ